MKLLICLITYNRLEFTKRTLHSLRSTIKVPHFLVIVDNNSSDGTQEWLKSQNIDLLILNAKNYYPGLACNIGWLEGSKKYAADYLLRIDNDMELFTGWDEQIEPYFQAFPKLGQLGMDYELIKQLPDGLEDFAWLPFGESGGAIRDTVWKTAGLLQLLSWPGFVGGFSVIKREVYDRGLRYTDKEWEDTTNIYHRPGDKSFASPQEDQLFSLDILKAGYMVGHIPGRFVETFGGVQDWVNNPEYYKESIKKRGYEKLFPKNFEELEKLTSEDNSSNLTV